MIGLLSMLLVGSSFVSNTALDIYWDTSQTNIDVLYLQSPRLKAHEHMENMVAPGPIRYGNSIRIVAIHATISALPSIHVQIWLDIYGLKKFFFVNSGTLGTAEADLSGIAVYVPANSEITLGYWCDNLSDAEGDFHASITYFYQSG